MSTEKDCSLGDARTITTYGAIAYALDDLAGRIQNYGQDQWANELWAITDDLVALNLEADRE